MNDYKPFDIVDLVEDGEVGISLSDFANALSVWSFLRDGPTTFSDAASAFNSTEGLISRAVEFHPYMFAATNHMGSTIEHDGE